MLQLYDALDNIQKIFLLIALPATVIMLLQTVLFLMGIGDGSGDGDGDADTGDDGLALFSIRGFIAMLCVGGWSGIVFVEAGINHIISVILAITAGVAALLGVGLLMKLLIKLQSSGNIDIGNAIGKTGQVYIPIPANMTGSGKINITIQDKYSEISAMTTNSEGLKTGELVRVVATDETGMVIVEKIMRNDPAIRNS